MCHATKILGVNNTKKTMEPSANSLGDEQLGEDDLFSILQELKSVAHRWYYIGLALRLKPSDLEKIRSNQPDDQFRNMILEWLKMNYNTEKHGLPTWRRIVEAVNASGENTFLANQLARKYGIVTHEKQPTSPTPDSDNIPNITSPIGEGICCCAIVRTNRNQPPINEFPLQPQGINRTSSITTNEASISSDTHTRSLTITKETSLDASIEEPEEDRRRRFSKSLPTNPHKYKIHIEPNLPDSQSESRAIMSANPTWQIEEIAQQGGYWGAMTGAMAEYKLKTYGKGNCYLIRYSERQNHFVVSVMRRNIQDMSQSTYHHFKLNVTKEDGHNIYEIDGSEKKFKDTFSLFQFYATNPLTFTNCTIGKACSPPLPLQYIS